MDRIRLDKWLWAARFYKTRSLAVQEIGKGRVLVNGQPAKPARERAAELRRLAPEPALDIAAGRPTKRDRRRIDMLRGK